MPPSTVARSVALWVAGSGGIPAGNEATLAFVVRERLNQKFDRFARTTTKVSAFLFGVEPILDYLKDSFSGQKIRALTREELALRVHRVFELIARRTELVEKYSAVLESVDEWHSIEAGLQRRLGGRATRPPYAGPPFLWWFGRRAMSIFLFICALLFYQLNHLFEVDRHRVYVYLCVSLLLVLGVLHELKGPAPFPLFLLKISEKTTGELVPDPQWEAESQVPDDVFPSVGGVAPTPDSRPSEASAGAAKVDKLASEMAEIRALVRDLRDSLPTPVGSPMVPVVADSPSAEQSLSESALPLSLYAALPPPGDPMPTTQSNAWSPLINPRRSAIQAGLLFDELNRQSGQKSTNPLWGVNFWREVGRLEHEQTLEPDLLCVLQGYGYCGAHTLGAPRDSLVGALRGLRDAGATPAGDPGFPPTPPGLSDTVAIAIDDRWQQGLPPDLKRAAPEIYRLCRAEGATNLREWINLRFQGDKSCRNPTWIHVWHSAAECDFAVARAGADNEMALLANDDGLEMKLRELASYVHFWRTGDLASSTNMLAVKPPGTETDVAPSWLVNESTDLSQAELQRLQRVKKDRVKGRGDSMKDDQPEATGGGSGSGGK